MGVAGPPPSRPVFDIWSGRGRPSNAPKCVLARYHQPLHPGQLVWDQVLSSRQITDAYLLALAVEHGGRFVTLDRGIPLGAVGGALAKHLVALS